mgnify:CR=1 FL=1
MGANGTKTTPSPYAMGDSTPPSGPGATNLVTAIPGVTCVRPKAALYLFPRLDPRVYPIADDQAFILELLEAERVLVVQGSGFNWPQPDHLRLVFLPNSDDLAEAMGRFARFLEGYHRRNT